MLRQTTEAELFSEMSSPLDVEPWEVLTFIVDCSGKKPPTPNKNKMASCSSQSVLPILSDNSGFGNWKFCANLVLDEKQLLETTEITVEDIARTFPSFDGLVHYLEDAGAKMDDTDKICHLLLTMGDNFNTVINAIETMKQDLTMENLGKLSQVKPVFGIEDLATQFSGELLHSDISGPVKILTATKEGERYFQMIVDDFSHFTTMYLLKIKSEAEENLMNFIKMVKTQHGVKSKRIRLNSGGEFSSNSFKKFCADKGIIIEYTTPYTPQQNS
ncbi:hypothetical protein PR048_000179 [Dryococelus australis]|uniref:Integrase catalytic domain-containing protein n=1 Tax=Dryococelus australis TaxID=614101 RepID=A0ABQ9IDY1_9NEOP|nr:hypothetical protein PR048_000179 [Dryococelus australis]